MYIIDAATVTTGCGAKLAHAILAVCGSRSFRARVGLTFVDLCIPALSPAHNNKTNNMLTY